MVAAGGPGRVFLEQLEATAAEIAQRRTEVRALVAQLTAFEAQLAAFEATLRPVLDMVGVWVDTQERVMDPFGLARRPKSPPEVP